MRTAVLTAAFAALLSTQALADEGGARPQTEFCEEEAAGCRAADEGYDGGYTLDYPAFPALPGDPRETLECLACGNEAHDEMRQGVNDWFTDEVLGREETNRIAEGEQNGNGGSSDAILFP